MTAVLYASVTDLRAVMSGTDGGSGSAAKLTDDQLNLALAAASARVSVYAGNVYDGSTPQAVAPDIFESLTLDLAAFYAFRTYLKHKEMGPTHPTWLAYKESMGLLEEVRAGKIRLDPAVAPGIGSETGHVVNRIPAIFTGADSNTRTDQAGNLEADTPIGQWTPRTSTDWADWGGAVYGGG